MGVFLQDVICLQRVIWCRNICMKQSLSIFQSNILLTCCSKLVSTIDTKCFCQNNTILKRLCFLASTLEFRVFKLLVTQVHLSALENFIKYFTTSIKIEWLWKNAGDFLLNFYFALNYFYYYFYMKCCFYSVESR